MGKQSHVLLTDMENATILLKTIWQHLLKWKMGMPLCLSIPLLRMSAAENKKQWHMIYMYKVTFSSVIP